MKAGPYVRGALLLYMVFGAFRYLTDAGYRNIFGGMIFGVHELGHLVFAFFGEWMSVAGGSFAQLALPAAAALLFHHRGDRFAVAVCGAWLAMSMGNLAVYVGDARAEALDLVSFSPDGAIHDWNYLLESLGLLKRDSEAAGLVRLAGWVVLLLSALLGLGTLRSPPRQAPESS